jgi:hypothetical protein
VENEFKRDLSEAMGTVMINKGKSLVKMTTNDTKKKKSKKGTNCGGSTPPLKSCKAWKPQPIR